VRASTGFFAVAIITGFVWSFLLLSKAVTREFKGGAVNFWYGE